MSEVKLNVKLIANTQLSTGFFEDYLDKDMQNRVFTEAGFESQAVALTAIRTCYSANKPTEIIEKEGDKYFEREATDGEGGSEADRLIRHIMRSKHTSTIEHLNYTFAIEGLSRAALAQLTRHRHMSYSVQSQRYVKFGSDDKSGGFDYVMPPSIYNSEKLDEDGNEIYELYQMAMQSAQKFYDSLRKAGIPAEDARMVLPNAAATNLTLTANLRALLEFYSKRKKGRGSQWEIADLAEQMRREVEAVDSWVKRFFDEV